MARPREFEMDVALDRAMQVFWSKGYEATSLDDLCGATGLGRSSLYAAFTDKRRLYIEVLKHYQERAVARVAKALSGEKPFRLALESFLEETIASIVSGQGRRGCLIGNSAAGLDYEDAEVATVVRQGIEKHERAFMDALSQAKTRGEIPASSDVEALARFLTAGFHGMRLVGKARRERAVLQDIAAVILRCLDA